MDTAQRISRTGMFTQIIYIIENCGYYVQDSALMRVYAMMCKPKRVLCN